MCACDRYTTFGSYKNTLKLAIEKGFQEWRLLEGRDHIQVIELRGKEIGWSRKIFSTSVINVFGIPLGSFRYTPYYLLE